MSRVIVRSSNIFDDVLLDTNEAEVVEFRDRFGDLIAVAIRIISDDVWGVVYRDDKDWDSVLAQYNLKQSLD